MLDLWTTIDPIWTAAQPILHGTLTAATFVGFVSAAAAALPKATSPGVYGLVRAVIDAIAFNFGNAKNAK